MKNILLLICIVFTAFGTYAQNGPKERIKAFKIAYITEKLDLTSKEAQQFWPIYNAHEKTVESLKKQGRSIVKSLKNANNGPDGLSDAQAGDFLNQYLDIEDQKSKARKKLIIDLKKTMSNKKVLRLIKAESDFNKRLLERVKQWRNNRGNN